MSEPLYVLVCPEHGPTTHYHEDHHEQRPRCPDPRCNRLLEHVEVVYRDVTGGEAA